MSGTMLNKASHTLHFVFFTNSYAREHKPKYNTVKLTLRQHRDTTQGQDFEKKKIESECRFF
jgi:competence CoiA-like predicted nuclease